MQKNIEFQQDGPQSIRTSYSPTEHDGRGDVIYGTVIRGGESN